MTSTRLALASLSVSASAPAPSLASCLCTDSTAHRTPTSRPRNKHAQGMSPSALEQTAALRTASIIEDVVPSSLASSLKGPLVVHYPEHTVSKGEAIPRAGTLAQPELEFKEAVRPRDSLSFASGGCSVRHRVKQLTWRRLQDTDATYTLFMVDPDLLKRNDTVRLVFALSPPPLPSSPSSPLHALTHTDSHTLAQFSGQVRHWFETGVKFEGTSGRVVISSQAGARNDYVPPSPAYGTGCVERAFLATRD